MTTMLQTHGLAAGYDGVAIVEDLSIRVEAGEVVALLGPNGAGKTTALLTIAGDLPLISGTVEIAGRTSSDPLYRRAQRGMALVTDDRAVFRDLTVAENLRLGDGDPAEALRIFPALTRLLDRKAGLLSGGEQQMLGMGRAMARKPSLLLADELSLGLSPMVVRELFAAVRTLADQGTAVVLVEQQIRLVLGICDRGYVLHQGRLGLSGPASDLLRDADKIERSYLAAAL
ncbi:MAG TPA: ABC transporter ATP-binding protein [Micromonosporaceae bacterium]|nr:ABC transporter ATP-binding protein [Micromonosporaceae bacterium]